MPNLCEAVETFLHAMYIVWMSAINPLALNSTKSTYQFVGLHGGESIPKQSYPVESSRNKKQKKPPQKQLRKAVATACCEIFFVRRFIDLCLPHVRPHKLRACNKHGGQFRSSFVKPNYNIEISLL